MFVLMADHACNCRKENNLTILYGNLPLLRRQTFNC